MRIAFGYFYAPAPKRMTIIKRAKRSELLSPKQEKINRKTEEKRFFEAFCIA